MATFTKFSDADKAAAPQLEPTLEAALRKYDVHEDIITGFRCNRIKSQAVFVALNRTVEGITDTLKEAFGVDPSKGFVHKRELAQLIAAWEECKIQSETKSKVDAVARAHGEPISHLPADWESIMKGFKQKHGANIPEYYLPCQSFFEAFEEKVSEGRLRQETLAQVVSLEEEEAQERSKPEQPKQLHLTLDANLTVQTRRRYLSSMPVTIEDLRRKYWVMTHMWLLAKMRQPSRPMYSDLDERTWNNFLEELLNRENINFRREIEGSGEMVGPDWNHCLEYEFQLRKEALRLIRDQGVSIQQALWAAYEDPQHRMKHWITYLTVANSRSQSSKALMDEVSLLRKEVAALRSLRSRSPRGQRVQKQTLALQDKPASKGKGGGKGRGKGKNNSKGGKSSRHDGKSSGHDTKGSHSFDDFQIKHKGALWHERANGNPGICFRFQRKQCKDAAKCNREHVCIGCARPGVSYNDCLCLEAKY